MFGPLSELFVDGFDNEQVWEEIQLTNEPFFEFLKQRVRKMATWKVHLCEAIPEGERGDRDANESGNISKGKTLAAGRGSKVVQFAEEVEVDEEGAASDLEGSLTYLDDEREPPLHKTSVTTKRRRSAVDDRFFKLSEMQEFLGKWCMNIWSLPYTGV